MRRNTRENGSNGLRAKVVRHFTALKRAGEPIWWLKVFGNRFQRPGVPDFLVCWGGVFGALELKQPGEHPTPIQTKEIADIRQAGGIVCVADSMEGVDLFLAWLRGQGNAKKTP